MRTPSIFHALLITAFALLTIFPTPCAGSGGSCLEFEGRWPYGVAETVAFSGSTVAYSAGSVLRFVRLDDPENPVQLGEVTLPESARHIELVAERSIALVVCNQRGLHVIDYSDPAEPVIASALDGYDYTQAAVAKGTIAFVTTSDGLLSVDFSDPTDLQLLGSPDPTIGASSAVISENFLFVTTSDGDLAIYDISDPVQPVQVSVTDSYPGLNLAVSGNFLFGTAGNSISVFDISNPITPSYLGYFISSTDARFNSLAINGSFLFGTTSFSPVPNEKTGVMVFEMTPENEIVEIGLWESDARTWGIAIVDGIAAVANSHRGLQVLDVGEPTALSVVSAIDGIGSINSVVKKAGFFIAAESGHGLRVIDLESPLPEQTVARLPLPPGAADLALMGDFAVVAGGSGGVHIVDLSSPLTPTLVAGVEFSDKAYRVVVQPPLAFVAAGTAGLRILDLTNPSDPQEIGHWLDPLVNFTVVSVAGDLAYLLSRDPDGPYVQIDISTPSNPTLVAGGKTRQTRYSRTINAFGNRLFYCFFLTDVGPFLSELDPDELEFWPGLGTLPVYNSCWDLAATGSLLFVPQFGSIMTCGFAKNGVIPVYGQAPVPGYPFRLTYASGKLLATSSDGGFVVFNVGFFCDGFETGDTSTWSAATGMK